MDAVDDLVLLAIVLAIASVIILALLVGLYVWALRRRRELDAADDGTALGEGPWDIP
jgi:hypothetical protein